MEEMLPTIGEKQLQWIKASNVFEMVKDSKFGFSCLKVETVLKMFDVQYLSFKFWDNIFVPFKSSKFSILMGLKSIRHPVNIDLKMKSSVLNLYFGGNVSNVIRSSIHLKLFELERKKNTRYIEDFARIFILFLFNCVIFSVDNYSTTQFILSYLDDLNHFFDYSVR